MTVNKLIFLMLFSVSILTVDAKKMYLPLEFIVGHSDLIVIGEIVKVNNKTYSFQVDQTLKGKSDQTITVEKFEEWMCDTRFDKHRKGQKLCLFLKQNKNSWEIINGGTGERPIKDNNIILDESVSYTSDKVALNEFTSAIKSFCECYELTGGTDPFQGEYSFKLLVTDEKLNTIAKQTPFTTWLFNKVKDYPKTFGF